MQKAPSQRIVFDHFEVLPAQRQILAAGQAVTLGARAFDLLLVLIDQRERVLGKDELLALVWPGMVVEENNLTVQISALRKLFGPGTIATVSGRGYRFVHPALAIQDLTAPAAHASAPVARAPERRKAAPLPGDKLKLPEKPSIAVLPFANFSAETDLEHFTDGLT
jgi:DNA-binding winged helix-turn-helix (wHTH) protein